MASEGGLRHKLASAIVPTLGAAYLRAVRFTMRLGRTGDESALPDDGGPVIYCFWHEQLAMMPWVQFRPPTMVPISRSHDGDYTAGLFRRLGVEPVRGSSSRDGAAAARGLARAIKGGMDAGITLDGPRGPAQTIQPGATWLARVTGRPLLPVAFACSRYLRLGSWDRMIVPLPLGRGTFVYGAHLWVDQNADAGDLRAADQQLAERVAEVTKRAETVLLT